MTGRTSAAGPIDLWLQASRHNSLNLVPAVAHLQNLFLFALTGVWKLLSRVVTASDFITIDGVLGRNPLCDHPATAAH